MSRRILLGLIAATALVLIPLILLSRGRGDGPIRGPMAGDVGEAVAGVATEELPETARGLLETDRPWRAARTMERYLAEVEAPSPEERVLAAEAHAGWGNWARVLELLEGVPSLDSYSDGLGLYLLARARDDAGDATAAAEAYRSFLAFAPPAGEQQAERRVARLRLGLALIRAGQEEAGRSELAQLESVPGDWLPILRADALADAGDTAAVRQAVAGIDSGIRGLRAWRARVEAARRAGDLARARALANQARSWASTEDTRAEFLLLAGRIAAEMGDIPAARDAYRGVIDRNPAILHARQAADLLTAGDMTPRDHLAVARVQAAQGLHQEAVEGFRRWLEADAGGARESEVLMELANSLFYSEEYSEVADVLEPIAGQTESRMLIARAEAHRGRTERAAELYLDIANDRAGTGTGSLALFVAAGTWHDAGDWERARELYQRVLSRYPGSDRAGLAMMRLAGIAYQQGDYAEAARIWDRYRARYPRGDRALQAMYWAGRARAEMGDSLAAAELYRAVRERERDSYYALQASERLEVPFWPLPMQEAPAADPGAARRVRDWMAELDLLREAGFDEAASALADDLAAGVGGDRSARYALAEALAERGYSQSAIRLGISLQTSGPPNRRLLQILYPLPYRTLITEEARDRGLDPWVATALIRQESMFEARITSPAGARGLMQIMPATGAELAEAAGMEPWDPEMLYRPEINVHLGTRYVAQFMDEYGQSLPSVFSAYNAGPHRVGWWSEFPEYGNDELFTERIPYRETRDYVKILTRNRALYEGLYGGEAGGAAGGAGNPAPVTPD